MILSEREALTAPLPDFLNVELRNAGRRSKNRIFGRGARPRGRVAGAGCFMGVF
jgi:hypothetical protein